MPVRIHIQEWVKRAEPDYYTLFIQSWIPYNAWYNLEFASIAGKTDSACIAYICDNPNAYKNKIKFLLETDTEEGILFRRDVAKLHHALLSHHIPEAGNTLNFSTMRQGNIAQMIREEDFYKNHYKVERIITGNHTEYDIRVEDIRTHLARYTFHVRHNQNFTNVETDPDYLRLTPRMQSKIREYFMSVNPQAPYDIVIPPIRRGGDLVPPPNCLVIDAKTNVYFVNDKDKIAQILTRLIYKLRCELFHGSVNPTDSNQEVFEYLFKVQSRLIKELA